MWKIALAFTLVAGLAGLYETWAIANDKMTITQFTRTHPHAAILIISSVMGLFGYVLGVGGL